MACVDQTRRTSNSPATTESRGSVRAPFVQALGNALGPAVTFATTEHVNLQTARAATVSDANGRASIYLAALSSNLIALAFIGQISRLGAAFYIAYAQRVARLRAFYLDVAPELEPFLLVVASHPSRLCYTTRRSSRALGSSRLRRRAWSRS
jgi:hypothetical protein